MPTVPLAPRVPRGRIRWRRSVAKLTAEQLAGVRDAYAWTQGVTDDRGYQSQAGVHGYPLPVSCQHTTSDRFASLFLPWHRAYLYFFERALRDRRVRLAHPWWDWAAPSAQSGGLPPAYADERSADGEPNPLHSVEINDEAMAQARRAGYDLPPRTRRFPGQPGTRLPTAAEVERLLRLSDFWSFSQQLEDLHGQVHVYVGGRAGHMSAVPLAAYDPIFWAHHAMIDRIWRIWQLRHPPPSFTADFLATALRPFPMTVAQTLSVRAMGYDYASSGTTIEVG